MQIQKIAAKKSEQFVKTYNFEMFTKRHDMLPKNMPILCGIYQILALSAEYKLYFNNKQGGNIVKITFYRRKV